LWGIFHVASSNELEVEIVIEFLQKTGFQLRDFNAVTINRHITGKVARKSIQS